MLNLPSLRSEPCNGSVAMTWGRARCRVVPGGLAAMLAAVAVFAVVSGCSCAGSDEDRRVEDKSKGPDAMTIKPAEFAHVPINTQQEHDLTPQNPDPGWRGVAIRGPEQVTLPQAGSPPAPDGSFAIVPICGFYRVGMDAQIDEPIKLVAREQASGRQFSGLVRDEDPSPEIPPPDDIPPADPSTFAGQSVGSAFNPNLLRYVTLPREAGVYEVHAEFAGYRSNVIRIELIEALR